MNHHTSFAPSSNFGKILLIAMKRGLLQRVGAASEINRLSGKGIRRMETNAYFLLHGMERLHGIGQIKEKATK